LFHLLCDLCVVCCLLQRLVVGSDVVVCGSVISDSVTYFQFLAATIGLVWYFEDSRFAVQLRKLLGSIINALDTCQGAQCRLMAQ
jgi:hypothetical protein